MHRNQNTPVSTQNRLQTERTGFNPGEG